MVTCGCCAECEELKAPGPGRRAPPLFRDRGRGHWGRRLPRPPPLDSSPRREEPLPGCAARAGTRQSRGQPRAGVLLGLSGEAWTAGMRGGPLFSEGSGTGGSWRKGCTPSGVRPPPGPSTYPAPHPPAVTAATGSLGAGPARPGPPRPVPGPAPARAVPAPTARSPPTVGGRLGLSPGLSPLVPACGQSTRSSLPPSPRLPPAPQAGPVLGLPQLQRSRPWERIADHENPAPDQPKGRVGGGNYFLPPQAGAGRIHPASPSRGASAPFHRLRAVPASGCPDSLGSSPA